MKIRDVAVIALKILGVYVFLQFLTMLPTGLGVFPQTPFLRRFYDNGSGLVSPSVGVVIGLLLIFRAKGLLRLIRLARPMSPERMTMG